jgi:hypothetical protein
VAGRSTVDTLLGRLRAQCLFTHQEFSKASVTTFPISNSTGAKYISDSGGSGFAKPDVTSHKPLPLPVRGGTGEEETAVKRASGPPDNHRRYRSRATAPPAVGFAAAPVAGRARTVTACLGELNSPVLQPIRCDRALLEVV